MLEIISGVMVGIAISAIAFMIGWKIGEKK